MGQIPIGVHADIIEVVRYDFSVLVDENLSVEEQDVQAKEKLRLFLVDNLALPNQPEYVGDVKCIDSVSVSQESIGCIEVNEDCTHS